jgi:tRNA(Ile2) C34 agmatinyltransferase TiaS
VPAVATPHTPRAAEPPAPAPEPRLFEPGGLTLEDVVLEAWNDLVARGSAECPVCGGLMTGAGGCGSCGAELS